MRLQYMYTAAQKGNLTWLAPYDSVLWLHYSTCVQVRMTTKSWGTTLLPPDPYLPALGLLPPPRPSYSRQTLTFLLWDSFLPIAPPTPARPLPSCSGTPSSPSPLLLPPDPYLPALGLLPPPRPSYSHQTLTFLFWASFLPLAPPTPTKPLPSCSGPPSSPSPLLLPPDPYLPALGLLPPLPPPHPSCDHWEQKGSLSPPKSTLACRIKVKHRAYYRPSNTCTCILCVQYTK